MSKDTVATKEVRETNNVIKSKKPVDYKSKWKEVKENLLIQHKESLQQAEIHRTRALKIEGTIEINEQLFIEEEESEG